MLNNTIRKQLVATGFLVPLYCGVALTTGFWPVPNFPHLFVFSAQTTTQTQMATRAALTAQAVQVPTSDGAILRATKYGQNAPETVGQNSVAFFPGPELKEHCTRWLVHIGFRKNSSCNTPSRWQSPGVLN
jgi:hypothetical protein